MEAAEAVEIAVETVETAAETVDCCGDCRDCCGDCRLLRRLWRLLRRLPRRPLSCLLLLLPPILAANTYSMAEAVRISGIFRNRPSAMATGTK